MKKSALYLLAGCLFTLGNCEVSGESSSGGHVSIDGPGSIRFSSEIAGDATPEVLSRILNVSNAPIRKMTFEKGTYHFYPDKAYEVYRYISNHDDVLTRSAFPLFNMEELTIDAQGSTFVFHGRMIPFIMEGSRLITIKNVSIDWATPFHSEGTVVANDFEKNTYDLKFSKEYPYVIRNGILVFLKEYYEHTMGQAYFYDPETRAVAYNTRKYSLWSSVRQRASQTFGEPLDYKYPFTFDPYDPRFGAAGQEIGSFFEQIRPGIVRVHNHPRTLPPIGYVQVMKGAKGINRTAPAIHIVESRDIVLESVTVLHAGGMGLIAENSEDLFLDRFNVIPPKERLVSATADGTHFVGCRGRIEMKNCVIKNQLDDATNIHGCYQEVIDVLDKHRLGVRIGHFQQQGLKLGRPGDKVGLIRKEGTIFPFVVVTLRSIEQINGRYVILTVDEVLSSKVQPGDLIENQDAYPEVVIRNCEFSGNRARGLLIASPKSTLIEDCFFHTEMAAILMPGGSSHWYESGHANNLTIRNNVFQDCSYGGGRQAVIAFHAEEEHHETTFRNIEIIGNTFFRFDPWILDVSKVDGFLFKNNTITHSDAFPAIYPDRPAFYIRDSKNVVFENNRYQGKAEVILETDDPDLSFN